MVAMNPLASRGSCLSSSRPGSNLIASSLVPEPIGTLAAKVKVSQSLQRGLQGMKRCL